MSFDEQNEAFDGNDDQPETSQEAMKQEGEVVQRKVSSVSSASSDCDIYMPLEETEVRFFNFQSFWVDISNERLYTLWFLAIIFIF